MPQAQRKTQYEDSYNRYITGGSYIPGSSAPAVRPERGRTARPERTGGYPGRAGTNPKRPARHSERAVGASRRKQPAYDIDIVRTKKNGFIRVAAYAAVFIGAFLCVASIAYTESRRLELNALGRDLNQLKIDNIILRGEINESYNLTEIEEYAVNTLGMVRPDESQIIYVDDAKVAYMVHYDVEEQEMGALDVLGSMVNSLIDIVADKTDK